MRDPSFDFHAYARQGPEKAPVDIDALQLPADTFVCAQDLSMFMIKLERYYEAKTPIVNDPWLLLASRDDIFFDYFDAFPMYISNTLLDVMLADNPPPVSFFKLLPSVFDIDKEVLQNHVLVYAQVLEKDGFFPLLNIGSAATYKNGALS